jgi:hypothetical protein
MKNHPNDDSSCAKFTGIAQVVKEADDVLLFVFDKKSMTADTKDYYFGEKSFIIDSACVLDDDFCAYLNLDQVLIKEGNYPVADTGSTYEVRLMVYPSADHQLL